MAKPETKMIKKINDALSSSIYKLRLRLINYNGIPDFYYSGTKNDIWVEYKMHPNNCTALQLLWLTDRAKEGRKTYSITLYHKKYYVEDMCTEKIDCYYFDDLIIWFEGILCK